MHTCRHYPCDLVRLICLIPHGGRSAPAGVRFMEVFDRFVLFQTFQSMQTFQGQPGSAVVPQSNTSCCLQGLTGNCWNVQERWFIEILSNPVRIKVKASHLWVALPVCTSYIIITDEGEGHYVSNIRPWCLKATAHVLWLSLVNLWKRNSIQWNSIQLHLWQSKIFSRCFSEREPPEKPF